MDYFVSWLYILQNLVPNLVHECLNLITHNRSAVVLTMNDSRDI